MGMRSYRSYYTGYSGDKYTEDMAGFEIALAAVGGLALVPFMFGLSLLVIPFVALKAHLSLPSPENLPRFVSKYANEQEVIDSYMLRIQNYPPALKTEVIYALRSWQAAGFNIERMMGPYLDKAESVIKPPRPTDKCKPPTCQPLVKKPRPHPTASHD